MRTAHRAAPAPLADGKRTEEQQPKKWLNDLNDSLKGGLKAFPPQMVQMVWKNTKTMYFPSFFFFNIIVLIRP